MSKAADKSDPKLWDTVKTEVTRSGKGGGPGQWSARKAQMAVQEHEKRGGHQGGDEEDTSLRKRTNGQNAGSGDDTEAEEPGRGELMGECGRVDTRQ
jgi:hypothetical protein